MIGLCYEPKDEKLTLSIKSVKIGSQSSLKVSKDVGLYAKGQEISEGNCGIFNFWTIFSYFCPRLWKVVGSKKYITLNRPFILFCFGHFLYPRAKIREIEGSTMSFWNFLTFKVTLFESLKVVKAKKTQPLKLTEDQGNFDETFSILFPISYMDQVILEFK